MRCCLYQVSWIRLIKFIYSWFCEGILSLGWPSQCEAQLLTTQPKHSHKAHENSSVGSNDVEKRHEYTIKTDSRREKMHPGLP
jgi:hypothetical protein